MKIKAIAQSVALAVGTMPLTLLAEEANTEKQVEEIEVVQVTGSRIKRADLEGIAPVVTITAADIELQGHANVFDALDALSQNTGIFVGEETSNNFNANAQAVNLRGFGPGYTLTLVNGRRIPVLPKPSDSVGGNIVNLALIPTEAVKRIEILSGGASAIYGSDAVAGVINVILKDDLDYNKVTARLGDTKDGGGASKKFTLSSGGTHDKFSYTAVLEIDQRDPIHGDDRGWFDEPSDGPDVTRHEPSQTMTYWTRWQPNPWMLNDLSGRCEKIGYESVSPGWLGENNLGDPDPHQCGDNVYDTYTVRNDRDNVSAFVNLEYETDDGRLFATLLGSNSEGTAGLYRYSYATDYAIYDDMENETGWIGNRRVQRTFRHDEVPTSNQEFDETSLVGIFGIEGVIADDFDYSVTFTASQYDYEDTVVRFDDLKMKSILFGEQNVDWKVPSWDASWVAVNDSMVNDNLEPIGLDFFGELTPDMFASAAHESIGDGDSYIYSLAFDLSGSIVELPAGDLQFALVTEYLKEGYEFDTDDATVNGEIYGWSGITGDGDRNRYAIGVEFLIPILDESSAIGSLEATTAGRYDYYDDDSEVGGAFTYQLGFSWRPIEEVMVRGQYATSFRAPDMHYMYAGQSSSFQSGVDYTKCVQDEGLTIGESWGDCSDDYGTGGVREYSQGDLTLKEESGDSLTIGIVANITDTWSITADYYEISLEDKVGTIGTSTVLRYEAECTVGFSEYGETIDPNSAKCQEMFERVERGGKTGDDIVSTVASPFNTGEREQKGMDLSSKFTHDLDGYGAIFFNLDYTHVFETNEKYLPEDELEDIRDLQWNNEFRTQTTATLGWYNDDLSVSLFANRLGTSPVRWSDDESERYGAFTRVNLNINYHVTDALELSASVVNLFDEKPPQHESEKWWPFADITKYNPVGLEYFVTASYKF